MAARVAAKNRYNWQAFQIPLISGVAGVPVNQFPNKQKFVERMLPVDGGSFISCL
jgi:hypothetical protein